MKTKISRELYDFIMEQNRITPYHRLLDMNITNLDNGFCEAEIKLEEKHMNPMNIAHGGVGFSILDVVSGTAATTTGVKTTTIEMNINYFRPTEIGDLLIAKGWIIKTGKSILVAEGKLYRDDDIVAVSRQSMKNLGGLTEKELSQKSLR
ncbi:PaaI family thioesterase [Natranaerobius thermophilus]|uniref:Thioesterase superfamily protein n=1 Tax=Natranaerobius thermophilus (strain ATCC BAA-1301 / DSM 18059 / JW/NM-WN-LF) TaxID=457570 RepID=B2A2Q9_NATTJ|nr:PaaI family thioesterase [Natranaerobius thermophilus]ACB86277.1 thioesterase superfamily protein [Natranaerobius thermophilus JW/NM-WN-LF]